MSQYTTNTSDKSKKSALVRSLFGFGLPYFYVGRIKNGIVGALISFFEWGVLITCIQNKETFCGIFIAVIIVTNLATTFTVMMGKFQDNIGNYLRE